MDLIEQCSAGVLAGLALWLHHFPSRQAVTSWSQAATATPSVSSHSSKRSRKMGAGERQKGLVLVPFTCYLRRGKKASPRIPRTQLLTKGTVVAVTGLEQSSLVVP